MGRHETIHLRETREIYAPNAPVIDAHFVEVGAERRTIWGRTKAALQAVLWAVAIGFLVPPAWVLVQTIIQTIWPR